MSRSTRCAVLSLAVGTGLCLGVASGQNFSVAPAGASGFAPGDILTPGPAVVLPSVGAPLFPNVDGFSYSYSSSIFFNPFTIYISEFSVDIGAVGAPGSSVASEAAGGAGGALDQQADLYASGVGVSGPGSNVLLLDGDGAANPSAPPPLAGALGLIEQPSAGADDVDGWDNGPPVPPASIWFTVDALSLGPPPPGGTGFTAADDIYLTVAPAPGYDTAPPAVLYATGAALGLGAGGDDIDALVVFEDGSSGYSPGSDVVIFSLAPGSPYIGTLDPGGSGLAITAGDILIDATAGGTATPSIFIPAESIGLSTVRSGGGSDDNLDALDFQFQVPEPAAAAFLLLGLGLLALRRRRA